MKHPGLFLLFLAGACAGTERGPRTATEARALWVTRMDYRKPEDVRAILHNAASHHFNVVLWQVRGNATAFYASKLEPWAFELTGDDPTSLGQDPGWDPLRLACREARRLRLELHAWVNVFPAWRRTVPPPPAIPQLWNTHRDWFMRNAQGDVMWPRDWWTYWYTFIDPGVPEVKEYLTRVFLEIVEQYPVDGLHFDYVRYPSEVGDWSHHPVSVRRFQQQYKDHGKVTPQSHPVQWAEWKRTQITEIVHAVHRDSQAVRPGLCVSAAVIHDWPRGYNDYSQDARTWLARGIVEATMPMLYRYAPADFAPVARDHIRHAHDRHVLPGLNAGRTDAADLLALIDLSRRLGATGVAIFSYRSLFPGHTPSAKARALLRGPFADRAAVPAWRTTPARRPTVAGSGRDRTP